MTDYVFTAGQVVAYFGAYDRVPQRQIVDRVTPSGIAVIDGQQYNKNGYARGASGYSTPHIRPWTEDHVKQVRQYRELYALQSVRSYREKFPRIAEAELRSIFDAAIAAAFTARKEDADAA